MKNGMYFALGCLFMGWLMRRHRSIEEELDPVARFRLAGAI